jgi:hypothetical protein
MFPSYNMFYKSIVDSDYVPNMSFGMVVFDDKFDKMWLSPKKSWPIFESHATFGGWSS